MDEELPSFPTSTVVGGAPQQASSHASVLAAHLIGGGLPRPPSPPQDSPGRGPFGTSGPPPPGGAPPFVAPTEPLLRQQQHDLSEFGIGERAVEGAMGACSSPPGNTDFRGNYLTPEFQNQWDTYLKNLRKVNEPKGQGRSSRPQYLQWAPHPPYSYRKWAWCSNTQCMVYKQPDGTMKSKPHRSYMAADRMYDTPQCPQCGSYWEIDQAGVEEGIQLHREWVIAWKQCLTACARGHLLPWAMDLFHEPASRKLTTIPDVGQCLIDGEDLSNYPLLLHYLSGAGQ